MHLRQLARVMDATLPAIASWQESLTCQSPCTR